MAGTTGKRKGLFSNSKKRNGYWDGSQAPIELVSCPLNGIKCETKRELINASLIASRNYRLNKEYHESIIELKAAFSQTIELQDTTCKSCVNLFRSTIIQSLEQIHGELRKMSTGIFKVKRYQSSFEFASETLEELNESLK